MMVFRHPSAWTFALLSALGVLGGVVGVDRLLHERSLQQVRGEVIGTVAELRARLEGELNATTFLVSGITHFVGTHPGITSDQFRAMARQMMRTNAPIRNIALAPDNVIRHIHPLEGNEPAMGLDLEAVPDQRRSVLRVMEKKDTVVAGPVELVQGDFALIIRSPIFTNDGRDYWGLASVPVAMEGIMERAGLAEVERDLDIAIRGRDGLGAEGDVFHGDPALFEGRAITQSVRFVGNQWQLAAAPAEGWEAAAALPTARWYGYLGLAILVGLLVGLLTRQALRVRDSERQHRELVQGVNGVVLRWGVDGRIRFINDQGARFFGYTAAELQGRQVIGTIVPRRESTGRDLTEFLSGLQRAPEDFALNENEVMHRDGRRFWMLWSNQALHDAHDRVVEILSIGQDQTRRREAEVELQQAQAIIRASEERYRTLTESLRDVVFQTDAARRVIYINPAWTHVTGWPRDEVIGRDWIELLYEADRPEGIAACDSFIAGMRDRCLEEFRVYCRDGTLRWMLVNAERVFGDGAGPEETVGTIGTMVDITEHKDLEQRIHYMAMHDNLTGLTNRRLFQDRLKQAIGLAHRQGHQLGLLFIDLDGFKPVNDTFGHDVGDLLLQQVAVRLSELMRSSDTVARFGGDEFVVLVQDLDHPTDAETVASKIIAALDAPFPLADGECRIGASIGISLYPRHGTTNEELLGSADQAMYAAKHAGRNTWRLAATAHADQGPPASRV
ncbi:MAG: diguanylate cyclase [Thiohalospira sp.]